MGTRATPATGGSDALPADAADALAQRLAEAREQQAATAEILRVISRSRSDAQPVFDAIASRALHLCNATFSAIYSFDGELIRIAALHGMKPEAVAAFRGTYPTPPGRGGATQRSILTREIVHMPDVREEAEYTFHGVAQAAAYRSVLAVPLLRDGQAIGTLGVYRDVPGPFPDSQIEALKTFADQALIAIENVRQFTELEARNRALAESLERETATGEILRAISRSRTDVQPVFDAIVRNAVRLCVADHGIAARFDGEFLYPLAFHGFSPEALEIVARTFPMRPGPGNMLGRATLKRAVDNLPDMLADPQYSKEFALAGGWRSGLGVPMFRDGQLIGAIAVSRRAPGAFPDTCVELLKTFADQAVIAIENVRLFRELEARNLELTEALEQQTATSEILAVISQARTDVQPVFDTIANAALKLCSASSVNVFTFDGELLHIAALVNLNPAYGETLRDMFPRPPGRDIAATRAIAAREVVEIPDVLEDEDYAISAHSVSGGFRSVLAVPLLRGDVPIGSIAVGRPESGRYPATQIALLQTFADQAVIAIENVRLFNELQARNRDLTEALEQQTATSEILRVISRSRTDVQPVFETIAAAAFRLCDAHFANVFTFDGELIHVAASENVHSEYAEALGRLYPRAPSRDTAAARAILTRAVVSIPDVLDDPEYIVQRAAVVGDYRSVLSVPLMRDGKPIGAIAVGRPEPRMFPDALVDLLKTFADQAVIAIENVRLLTELEARTAQLTRSVEKLRALGEVGQAVSSTLDLETVLRTIVSRATQLADMDGGSMWEYDETRELFHLHAADNLPDELVEALRNAPLRKGEGAVGRVAVTGQPVQILDIVDDGIYQSRVRDVLIRCGYRSVVAVPLLCEDRLLGALAVNRSTPGESTAEVIELLRTFGTQSALAIQNARLFREIEVKSRELESASRHKSEFLANMSHELRTPLNAIIGFSEVLSERMFGEINDKQAEYLRDILESGRHLLSLINDILDLAKIEAGRMELEAAEFDLPAAIGNTLILLRERAARRGIALERAIDPNIGTLLADERKVKQVLLNLMSNALKFTPEGGRVDVRAELRDGAVQIAVTDTGIGISPEDQATVFEEFRQVGATAKKVEGTGLGLAISRKFVELHGGSIRVESRVGEGSTFTFTLPLR